MQVNGHKQMIYFMIMLVKMIPNEVLIVADCRLSGVTGGSTGQCLWDMEMMVGGPFVF